MKFLGFIILLGLAGLSCEEPAKKAQYVESTAKPVDPKIKGKSEDGIPPPPRPDGGDPDKTETDENSPPSTGSAPSKGTDTAANGKLYCKSNGGQGYGSEFDCGGGLKCKKDDGSTYSDASTCVIKTAAPPSGGTSTTPTSSYLSCSGNQYCNSGYGWLNEGESECGPGKDGYNAEKQGCSCKC